MKLKDIPLNRLILLNVSDYFLKRENISNPIKCIVNISDVSGYKLRRLHYFIEEKCIESFWETSLTDARTTFTYLSIEHYI